MENADLEPSQSVFLSCRREVTVWWPGTIPPPALISSDEPSCSVTRTGGARGPWVSPPRAQRPGGGRAEEDTRWLTCWEDRSGRVEGESGRRREVAAQGDGGLVQDSGAVRSGPMWTCGALGVACGGQGRTLQVFVLKAWLGGLPLARMKERTDGPGAQRSL